MKRRLGITVAALLVLLVVAGTWWGPPESDDVLRTFGSSRDGYGALLELLTGLGVPAALHAGDPDALPATEAAWWIAPPVCDDKGGPWAGRRFVEQGGTALVLLPRRFDDVGCRLGNEIVIPQRTILETQPSTPNLRVSGRLVPAWRDIPPDPLTQVFVTVADWIELVTIAGRPLVIERAVGQGRVLLVSDARLFRNQRLDAGDTAPLVVDLVRATGVPRFVEWTAVRAGEIGALAYLLRSPAMAVIVGLMLVGVLVAWQGTLVPPRRLASSGTNAPTLEAFVNALAELYARSEHWPRLAARYREVTVARLRRHLGLPPETAIDTLVARLERDARFGGEALAPILSPPVVTNEGGLEAAVAALDALVARTAG